MSPTYKKWSTTKTQEELLRSCEKQRSHIGIKLATLCARGTDVRAAAKSSHRPGCPCRHARISTANRTTQSSDVRVPKNDPTKFADLEMVMFNRPFWHWCEQRKDLESKSLVNN